MTVYLSIVLLLLISLVLVLLESARVYVIGTMSERYADMAAEMLFSSYVRPLADQYGIFVLDMGEDEKNLEWYENFLKLNLEESQANQDRIFNLYGTLQSLNVTDKVSVKDNDWQSLKNQIARYEKYMLGEKGVNAAQNLLKKIMQTDVDDTVGEYTGELNSKGAQEEKGETSGGEETASESTVVSDPREGISSWIKSGILNLAMDGKTVSSRTINVEDCSYQVNKSKTWRILTSFDGYQSVGSALKNLNIVENLQQMKAEQEQQLLINVYILDQFKSLCKETTLSGDKDETVLQYEIEYILYGCQNDRENLEKTLNAIFALRTGFNLAYLYTSHGKTDTLQSTVEMLAAASVMPIAGELLKLLLMSCWAAAEAVVDCAALVDGKKVPLMKDDNSWNLSMAQLVSIGRKGGSAGSYVKDGSKGLNYENYLLIMLMLMSSETKLIRMTQLMEKNVQMTAGYASFKFSRSITAASWKGSVQIQPQFWQHPVDIIHPFFVTDGYEQE